MKCKTKVSYTQNSEDTDGNISATYSTCGHLGTNIQHDADGVHLADTHTTTTTVHIYGDTSTLLPYNGHTVVMSNWIANSSLFYLEYGDKFSSISGNFYNISWLHIPFSIILYHTSLTC
jgi:hypothetical protein